MTGYCEFLENIDEIIATQKFEDVLEIAYEAIMNSYDASNSRKIYLKDALETILEKKTPYFRKKMMKNCFKKPYSKWLEVAYDIMVEIEAKNLSKMWHVKSNRIPHYVKDVAQKSVFEKYSDVIIDTSDEELVNVFYDLIVFYENDLFLNANLCEFCDKMFRYKFHFSEGYIEFLCRKIFARLFDESKYRLAIALGKENLLYIPSEWMEMAIERLKKMISDESNTLYTDADKQVCLKECELVQNDMELLTELCSIIF